MTSKVSDVIQELTELKHSLSAWKHVRSYVEEHMGDGDELPELYIHTPKLGQVPSTIIDVIHVDIETKIQEVQQRIDALEGLTVEVGNGKKKAAKKSGSRQSKNAPGGKGGTKGRGRRAVGSDSGAGKRGSRSLRLRS